jgi:hypothetical protein
MRGMRFRSVLWGGLVTLVAMSCGSTPEPVTPSNGGDTAGGGGSVVSPVRGDPTPESICARVYELKASSCELTSGYDLTQDECVADFHKSFEDRGADARQANISLGRCLIDNASCEAVGTCITNLSEPESGFRECGARGSAPVAMPRSEWEQRKAATVKRFSEASSTKDEPIEVCSVWDAEGQIDWLLSKTCDDGSKPFKGTHHAHAARVQNVGEAGRCNSIIDLYEVPCPEGTYKIFLDAYVCPQDDPPVETTPPVKAAP